MIYLKEALKGCTATLLVVLTIWAIHQMRSDPFSTQSSQPRRLAIIQPCKKLNARLQGTDEMVNTLLQAHPKMRVWMLAKTERWVDGFCGPPTTQQVGEFAEALGVDYLLHGKYSWQHNRRIWKGVLYHKSGRKWRFTRTHKDHKRLADAIATSCLKKLGLDRSPADAQRIFKHRDGAHGLYLLTLEALERGNISIAKLLFKDDLNEKYLQFPMAQLVFATAQAKSGDFKASNELLLTIKKELSNPGRDAYVRSLVYKRLAYNYLELGDHRALKATLREGISFCRRYRLKRVLIQLQTFDAAVVNQTETAKDALATLKPLLERSRYYKDHDATYFLLLRMAKTHLDQGQYFPAFDALSQCERLVEDQRWPHRTFYVLTNQADLYSRMGDPDLRATHIDAMRAFLPQVEKKWGLMDVFKYKYWMSYLLLMQPETEEEARANLAEITKEAAHYSDIEFEILPSMVLAQHFLDRNETHEAERWILSLKYRLPKLPPHYAMLVCDRVGRLFSQRGEFGDALEYVTRHHALAKKLRNRAEMARALTNKAEILEHLCRDAEATGDYIESLRIKEDLNLPSIAYTLKRMIPNLERVGKTQLAAKYQSYLQQQFPE